MKQIFSLLIAAILLAGCGGGNQEGYSEAEETVSLPKLTYTEPEPMPVPEYIEPQSETDWKAKVNNKEIEVISVINILNPVAAYLTAGFKQYGEKLSPTLQEEWVDTQVQLGSATTLFGECSKRKESGEISKQLFLDLEETWQLLVKTGVAGLRTKSMLDAEMMKFAAK